MPKHNLTAEIVIPTYNRLHILRETLQKIRLIYPYVKICVGLQGDMPDKELQAELDKDPNLRIEELSEPSTTKTLNHCISTSQANVILILDDDAMPCHGWLEAHISAFTKNPDLAYTSGREVRTTKGHGAFSEVARILLESICGLFLKNDTKLGGHIVGWTNGIGLLFGNFDQPGNCRINSPRGCNMAVQKEPFLTIGKFSRDFTGNAWGFEADFGLRMANTGRYGLYIGQAVVLHHEITTGGSRNENRKEWFRNFLHNHKIVMKHIGPLGWIGSAPRLLKNYLRTFRD